MTTAADRYCPVLIAGQGLAGSLLALALEEEGIAACVLDPGNGDAASLAAAGSLNPCPSRSYGSPAPLDDWLPVATRTWSAIAERLDRPLIRSQPLIRLFRSADDAVQVRRRRTADPAVAVVLSEPLRGQPPGCAGAPGHVRIHAWQVDLPGFLAATRAWLLARGRLLTGRLSSGPLPQSLDGRLRVPVGTSTIETQALVLAEGAAGTSRPELTHLPWRLSRGDAVILDGAGRLPDQALRRQLALHPLGDGRHWLGSSYRRLSAPEHDPGTGDALLARLSELLDSPPPVRVLEQRSGVRPGSRTDLPLCGPVPGAAGVWLFNGLGSRGTLLGPRSAARLAARLARGLDLPTDWLPDGPAQDRAPSLAATSAKPGSAA